MKTRSAQTLLLLVLIVTFTADCMGWRPEWNRVDTAGTRAAGGATKASLEQAREASQHAVTADALHAAMAAHELVLAQDAQNYASLVALADHSILLATAYTESRGAKREFYERAMRLAERAMYTNPDFKRLADGGARPWVACSVLTEREMGAMMAWMTALLYKFKECMSPPVRVVNVRWITRLDPILDRMEQIDEKWEGGAVPFTRAFYYFILPRSLGGDRELAASSFARAVELGPTRVLSRWGRAKFFHVLMKDRAGFVEDLEWVASRDVQGAPDPPAWSAYIQRDATRLLQQVDRLF